MQLLGLEQSWTLILDDALANSFIAPGTDDIKDDHQLTCKSCFLNLWYMLLKCYHLVNSKIYYRFNQWECGIFWVGAVFKWFFLMLYYNWYLSATVKQLVFYLEGKFYHPYYRYQIFFKYATYLVIAKNLKEPGTYL